MSSLISLVVVEQEPRVDSRLIAEQLGVEHESTRKLIEQYQPDFEEFGVSRFEIGKPPQGSLGGRPEKFYLLNEDQAYLLLTYTKNTPQARDLKKRLVKSFGEYRRALLPRFRPEKTRKALPGGLTLEQQDAVKALIRSRVGIMPHDAQAKAAITCWSAIKSKFGVSYKAVPAEHFGDVLSLVARLELTKDEPKALPLEIRFPAESAIPKWEEKHVNSYGQLRMCAANTLFCDDWKDPEWALLSLLREAGFNVDGPIISYQLKMSMLRFYHLDAPKLLLETLPKLIGEPGVWWDASWSPRPAQKVIAAS